MVSSGGLENREEIIPLLLERNDALIQREMGIDRLTSKHMDIHPSVELLPQSDRLNSNTNCPSENENSVANSSINGKV